MTTLYTNSNNNIIVFIPVSVVFARGIFFGRWHSTGAYVYNASNFFHIKFFCSNDFRLRRLNWLTDVRVPSRKDFRLRQLNWLTDVRVPPRKDFRLRRLNWLTNKSQPP